MADQVTQILSAVVANGESLSGIIDVGPEYRAAFVVVPSGWDAADITFQASVDGTNFFNLHIDSSDTEFTVQAAASKLIVLPATVFAGLRWLKVRSGTSGSAVNQTGAVTVQIGVARL